MGLGCITLGGTPVQATNPTGKLSTPTISCKGATQTSIKVEVCAGAAGRTRRLHGQVAAGRRLQGLGCWVRRPV